MLARKGCSLRGRGGNLVHLLRWRHVFHYVTMTNVLATMTQQDLLLPPMARFAPRFVERLTSHLTPADRADTRTALPQGSYLFHPGERNADRCITLVASGVIALEYHSAAGRRSIFEVLSGGEFFGEETMVSIDGIYSPTAMSDSEVFQFDLDTFQDLLTTAGMTEDWNALLVLKCLRLQALVLQYGTMDCECRLAMRLQSLAATLGEQRPTGTLIPLWIRHEDFGAMIGTTRSRVGYFLQRFEESGIISRDGSLIEVHDRALLRYLSERTGVALVARLRTKGSGPHWR